MQCSHIPNVACVTPFIHWPVRVLFQLSINVFSSISRDIFSSHILPTVFLSLTGSTLCSHYDKFAASLAEVLNLKFIGAEWNLTNEWKIIKSRNPDKQKSAKPANISMFDVKCLLIETKFYFSYKKKKSLPNSVINFPKFFIVAHKY